MGVAFTSSFAHLGYTTGHQVSTPHPLDTPAAHALSDAQWRVRRQGAARLAWILVAVVVGLYAMGMLFKS